MQTVRKKTRHTGEKRRLLLLAALALLAALGIAGLILIPEDAPVAADRVDPSVQLTQYAPAEVASITIRRGEEAPWNAENTADLSLVLQGEDGFALTPAESADLLEAARALVAEDVLTDDPAEYRDRLADFGLDAPELEARIVYTDGAEVTLRVGDKGPDGAWRYMLMDGDDRLFAFSNGSVDALFVNRDTLRKVSQPPLHKARIARVTLHTPAGVIEWTLEGDIHDADAIDRWQITQPFQYPADAAAMTRLLTSVAGVHLGAYVGPATPEKLAACGFDAPRLTIDVHLAAGTIATNSASGAAEAVDYPDQTLTYVIGGEKSDLIDYVLFDGHLYTTSRFNIGMFLDYDVRATMSRYPVMVALGNLAKLTIIEPTGTAEYVLTRTERVAANNELVTDEDGSVLYDVTVTRNGEPYDYDAFAAVYNVWSLVTVSGVLPEGEYSLEEPPYRYIFTDVDGTVHEVGLTTFDALHDAVIVDGHAAFYLIKGGFTAPLPQ